jgi:hypothetical protein
LRIGLELGPMQSAQEAEAGTRPSYLNRAFVLLTLAGSVPAFGAGLGYNASIFEPFLLLGCWAAWISSKVVGALALKSTFHAYRRGEARVRKPSFLLPGCLLLVVSLFPVSFWFLTGLQALVASAGGPKMVAEGQELIRQYRARYPNPGAEPKGNDYVVKNWPPAIAAVHPGWVWVSYKDLRIKINGFGIFEGFVIPADGEYPGGLRLAPGLYWANEQ